MTRASLALAALLASAALLRPARGGERLAPAPAAPPLAPVAPAPLAPGDGAARAASFDELRALVADPAGPRVIELAPGVHRGDLTVSRPVTIRGAGDAVLEGTGAGTVLAIDASDVTVEHLHVRGSGHRHTAEDAGIKAHGARVRVADVTVDDALFGVIFRECHACTLERARVTGPADDTELRGDGIKLWESHDSIVRGCTVERSRDVVVWYTKRALLEDNVVRRSRYGTHFMYAHDAVVRNSRFEDDVVGVFVMYSMRLRVEDDVMAGARGAAGVGIGFKDSDAVEVRRSWLVANTAGLYLDDTPRTPADPVTIADNVLALDDVAVRVHGASKGVTMTGNDFRDDPTVIEVDGGDDARGIDARGNWFSDYEGYDLDGDGAGDVPYQVRALSSELTEQHPQTKLLHGTAAMGFIDAVAHAVPVLASRVLFTDRAPRMDRIHAREP